ncbi:P2X purinoceptor 7-like isoform X2 [Anneissia japonica]|nr:P2X purinoceptor 7-like isoform X2 [Anneissia japonica]XP_033103329.1 P2X purinoceptor 7-like isoform X2 [Anneissia japonica]
MDERKKRERKCPKHFNDFDLEDVNNEENVFVKKRKACQKSKVVLGVSVSSADVARVQALRTSRLEKYKEMIRDLPEADVRQLLFRCLEKNQGLVIDVVDKINQKSDDVQPTREAVTQVPDWCVCSYCKEMPTDLERLCCNMKPELCLSKEVTMDAYVLNELSLAFSRARKRDFRQIAELEPEEQNKSNRHHSYMLFIYWRHQRLLRGDRRIIPSCCVWRIRDKFPSPTRTYRGFDANVHL